MPIFRQVNKNFFKQWSSDMAYVLGFFAADGYITVNKRGGEFWCIQITDKDLLYSIRNVIESNHAIGARKLKVGQKPLYRLQIGSKEMCDDLRHLGFNERKTKSLALPNVPSIFLADFVRGYFDGDGNVWVGYMHKERKIKTLALLMGFTSGSKNFLECLQTALSMTLCTRGSVTLRKNKLCWCLRYAIKDSLKLCDFMYNSSVSSKSLFLTRKKLIFEKYKEMQS